MPITPVQHQRGFRFAKEDEAPESTLSQEFVARLLRFVSWEHGWDGQQAASIPSQIAAKAYALALQSAGFMPEPFIAPADGALLLRWHLPNKGIVEVFVDETEIEYLALVKDHDVREIPATGDEGVLSFLRSQAFGLRSQAVGIAGWRK